MKKTVKKLTAVGLTLTTVMGLVACGNKENKEDGTKDNGVVTKPKTISVMVDNTIVAETNGGNQFYEELEKLMKNYGDEGEIDLQFTRPEHSGYYDAVANTFNGNDKPDVVILSSDYYALYSASGMLWDMTDAWDNSETKKSGKLISGADKVLSALVVNNEEGEKGMFGFSPYRGNGCCTYVKEDWLKAAGIEPSSIKGKKMTFNEYYELLTKLKAASKSSYVISSPGFVSDEAPYTNYLPEWFQKANFTFYKDASGKYVDGFQQQEMIDALTRIQKGVKDGIINKGSDGAKTSAARDIFYSTDPTTESGVFTYWAGTWAETLRSKLEGKKRKDGSTMSGALVAIDPITELGTYVERLAPAWCITADCENPEGVFKYFIDTMLDGGDFQTAWQYGAKGTHWDDKAETFTLKGKDGKEGASYSYAAGEFHFLASPEDPTTLMKKNHIDPVLALRRIENDPGQTKVAALVWENGEWFSNNCSMAVPLPMTEELGTHSADINKKRKEIISKVALDPSYSAEQGIKDYKAAVGSLVDTVLKSLNK